MKICAIILAAGKGTRMKSLKPKVLHSLCGLSLVERTIRAVHKAGVSSAVVVVGYGREAVEQELERVCPKNFKVKTAFQKEQNGTGHAAKIAVDSLSESYDKILILPGDMPLVSHEQIKEVIDQSSNKLTLVSTKLDDPFGYGRVVKDSKGSVQKIVEQKDASEKEKEITEVNASIYLADLDFLKTALEKITPNNAQGEYYLTDIVEIAKNDGIKAEAICVTPASSVMGANSQSQLRALEKIRREQILEKFMSEGVEFEDSSTAYIDEDVEIKSDTFIGASTWLKGKVSIEQGVVLYGNCYLKDCKIGKNTEIKFGTVVEDSSIEANCAIGPYARIRPGTEIANDVKIGNFVETKKAKFRDGAKASHLSYIGDAEVGEDANLGAGTITCNYDGINKHQTNIGSGAFIGSNSALVAPVKIGQGAYVGAGSVVTTDVPEGSLAVARSKQKNIIDWASKKAKKK